jgi:hypothetical protein
MTPDITPGAKAVVAFCEVCGNAKMYTTQNVLNFPDCGWWTPCVGRCAETQYHFRIEKGRVVNTGGRTRDNAGRL